MSFKLTQDNILVKQKEIPERVGSIIIPDTVNKDGTQRDGEVIAVGHGFWVAGELVELQAKAGNKITYWSNMAKKVTVDGDDYVLLKEAGIIAIYG